MCAVRSPYFTRTRTSGLVKDVKREINGSGANIKAGRDAKLKRKTALAGAPVVKKEFIDNDWKDASSALKKPQQLTASAAAKNIKLEIKEEPTYDQTHELKAGDLKWMPKHWTLQLENIRIMRREKDAPVDTMGCEKCKGEGYSAKDKRFHTLVSLMLSSQTKDQITHSAMLRLIDNGLTANSIIEMSNKKLGELIYPVGFWKKKVIYLKKTSEILKSDYDGDIPRTVENLIKLPGVGPKMAYLAMTCAWDQVVGIGVDVHVHRISNRLGWVRKKTTEPEKTRKELEDWLPQSYWKEVNWLLVGFGQQICLPVSPKCADCLNKDICPASTAKTRFKTKK